MNKQLKYQTKVVAMPHQSVNWFVLATVAVLMALATLFALNAPAHAQEADPEPVQITDEVVLAALLEGDLSVLENQEEVRAASETIVGYSLRHNWYYPDNLQVYVNNSERDYYTQFFIQARQTDGRHVNRRLTANMTPVSTYFERTLRPSDPVSVAIRMSDGGRSDSMHNAQTCANGPMIIINRDKNGRTYPVISNNFIGQTIYYRLVGENSWYELADKASVGWAVYSNQGSLEVKLQASQAAPLCALVSWDWQYQEVPVQVNLPANSEWDPQTWRTIGVELKDIQGREVTDFRFQITYPSSFATYGGLVMRDDLINVWLVSAHEVIDQQTGMATLTVGGATQGAPVTEDDLLVNLTFKRNANPVREETFMLENALLNAGTIYSVGSTGYVKVMPYTVSGNVYHPNGQPFPNVGVDMRGSFTQVYTQTLSDGSFVLRSSETGSHQVGFGYDTVLADTAINHSDASTILRCSVGAVDCVLETMDIDWDRFVSPHDVYVLIQELLGNTLPESHVGWFQCNPQTLYLNLTFSQYGAKSTCWLVGDANDSVLPMMARAAEFESVPTIEFGTQISSGDIVTLPLTIMQPHLDGATIDLDLNGIELVGAVAQGWEAANNGYRIIVYGTESKDTIAVNLTLRGEGTVKVSQLQTIGETVYTDLAETTVTPKILEPVFIYLPLTQR